MEGRELVEVEGLVVETGHGRNVASSLGFNYLGFLLCFGGLFGAGVRLGGLFAGGTGLGAVDGGVAHFGLPPEDVAPLFILFGDSLGGGVVDVQLLGCEEDGHALFEDQLNKLLSDLHHFDLTWKGINL